MVMLCSAYSFSQTQYTLEQINALWNTRSVPLAPYSNNTWYSLVNSPNIIKTSTLTLGYFPYAISSRTLANSPVFTNGVNVGVGTSTPGSLLDVNGNANISGTITVAGCVGCGGSSSGNLFGSQTTGYIPYATSQYTLTDSPFFTDGTNIGLGTTTPSVLFHLYKSDDSDTPLEQIRNPNTGTFSGASLLLYSQIAALGLAAYSEAYFDATLAGNNRIYSTNGSILLDSQEDLIYRVNSGTERMRILQTGEVGIGTSTPASALDVSGNENVSGSLTTSSITITGGATNGYVLTSDANGTGTWQPVAASSSYTATSIYGIGSVTITSNNGNSTGTSFTVTVNVPTVTTYSYSAGFGLALNNIGTFSVTGAFDKTVTATAVGTISVTGTYPDFTITQNNQTYNAGFGLALSGNTFSVTSSAFINTIITFTATASQTVTIASFNSVTGNYRGTTAATAFALYPTNLSDGQTLGIDFYKTTASNTVITFPAGTIVSQSCNAIVSGVTATLVSTTAGEFEITIINHNGINKVYISQDVN